MRFFFYYISIALLTFCFGIFFFAFYNNWIVIQLPFYRQEFPVKAAHKKKITLFCLINNKWKKEQKEILASANKSQVLYTIINSWLSLAEEQLLTKKIELESSALSASEQELFISFNRIPFSKKSSTYERLVWLESLLKTIRANSKNVRTVRLLVHQKPLNDPYLDFSQAWPVQGFLSIEESY